MAGRLTNAGPPVATIDVAAVPPAQRRSAAGPARGADARRRRAARTATVSIGRNEAGASQVEEFGRVQDAVVLPDGRIVVLDSQARAIRVFDAGGKFVQSVGRAGDGPGEFRSPVALDLDVGRRLYAFDALGRVQIYATRDSLRWQRAVNLRTDIRDGCVLHGVFVIGGMRPGGNDAIQVFDSAGVFLRSFGTLYRTRNAIIREQLSSGYVACSTSKGIVLFAPAMLPEVEAYDLEGRPLWWIRLSHFQPMDVVEIPRGSVLRRTPDPTNVTVALVASADGGSVILQVARLESAVRSGRGSNPRPVAALLSYIIRPREMGAGIERQESGPHVFWFDGSAALVGWQLPYPRVQLLWPAEN